VGVFRKLPRKNDLDHKSSRLLIRWLNSTPGIQPAKLHTQPKSQSPNHRTISPIEHNAPEPDLWKLCRAKSRTPWHNPVRASIDRPVRTVEQMGKARQAETDCEADGEPEREDGPNPGRANRRLNLGEKQTVGRHRNPKQNDTGKTQSRREQLTKNSDLRAT
jgi:hypothetical protein